MTTEFEDDDLLDEDLIEEEDIPEVKVSKSNVWRDIESLREERALQKKLSKEYDLEGIDSWEFEDDDV